MKIGIDISPIFHQRGGIGTYTLHLIEHLVKLETTHHFFLYSTQYPTESFSFLERSNVQLVCGGKLAIRYHIWKENIDIVHGPNFRLPGKGRIGNVLTIHDLALVKYPAFGKKRFGSKFSSWKTFQRALSADRIIADSYNTGLDIIQFIGVPKEKISVIYMGVAPFFFPEDNQDLFMQVRKKYGLRKKQYILFAGTIEPRKNILTLIQAYARNERLRKHYEVVLAGSAGWDYQKIEALIQKEKIEADVHVTGYLPIEDLRILYSFASCFVFPSIYEGFGIPPLEAMACGTPVICSNSSSLPEVVGDAALMADPYDIDGFSTGIEKILENEVLRKDLIQRGFERVKHFSWLETARKTMEVYEEVYHLFKRVSKGKLTFPRPE